jgi:hypothetical protein
MTGLLTWVIAVPERWGGVRRRQWRRQPTSSEHDGLGLFETRPAPVFFVPAGALLARVVQKPLCDVAHRGSAPFAKFG